MEQKICLSEEKFDKMEKDVLKQVMNTSKSIIETFKFRTLFSTHVSPKQNESTIKAVKEFRAKNWDTKCSRTEAYKKYMNLY